MTFRPIVALLIAASESLLGCSGPNSAPAPVQETQSVKQIIANAKIDQLFTKQVDAKNVAVGPDRDFITAGEHRRGACYRAEVGAFLSPGQRRTVTFVALVDGNQIIDRRSAKSEDRCELDSYERLGPLPSSEN